MTTSSKILPVLLCGGEGKRLQPLIGAAVPKQFYPFDGERSLFQLTLQRAGRLSGLPPLVVTHVDYAALAEAHADAVQQPVNVLVEQARSNTGPAVALAVAWAEQHAPDAVLAVLPCDHVVTEEAAWDAQMRDAATLATADDAIVTFGIPPHSPSEQFGYLQLAEDAAPFQVERFIEKPELEVASALVGAGAYWNSGMFVATRARWSQSYADAAPDGTIPPLPIDRLIMEKSRNLRMLPARFDWRDIGTVESCQEWIGEVAD